MPDSTSHLRLRRLNSRPGMSVRGLERELGMSHPTLLHIETGQRDTVSIRQVVELAEAFRSSPSAILRDLLLDRPHLLNGSGRPKGKRGPRLAHSSPRRQGKKESAA